MTAPTAVRRPTGIGRVGVALAAVSALSSAPSAFYHVVQSTTGAAWTTSLLFVAYGSAQLVTTATVAARPRWSPDRTARAGFVLLLVGGALLVVAPEPGGAGVLLLGRLVTGAGAGLLVPAVAGAVVGQDGGGRAVTAGVLGGAGVGAVVSGVLAEAGVARGVVLALGVLAVGWAVSRLLTLRLAVVRTAATAPTSGSGPSWRVAALVVFTANGLLALASSTVPGVVVDAVGGGPLVAGLTTGVVLLAAGAARLLVPTTSPLARPGPALAVAALAAVLLGAGLSGVVAGPVGATVVLGGGAILGGLCGLAYDRALASASPVGRTLTAAQLGLVLPVLLWPLVVR